MNDCVFCKIITKEIPSTIIFEDQHTIVFKNIYPVADHHYLICPKKHVKNFMGAYEEMISMTETAQKIIKDLNLTDGYKLVFNGGKYQSIPHLHWHLLSGKLEDENDILNKT